MTLANRTEARDEILAKIKTVIDTLGIGIAIYDDTKGPKPDTELEYVRVTVRHGGGERSSLSNGSGKARHERTGIVIVQIFTPSRDGLTRNDAIAQALDTELCRRDGNSNVWYRDVRNVEVGNTETWFQTNTIATFVYDLII